MQEVAGGAVVEDEVYLETEDEALVVEEEEGEILDMILWHAIIVGYGIIWLVTIPPLVAHEWVVVVPLWPVVHLPNSGVQTQVDQEVEDTAFDLAGSNVMYDFEGHEYPVDDYGQIYILLESEFTGGKESVEDEKEKHSKN